MIHNFYLLSPLSTLCNKVDKTYDYKENGRSRSPFSQVLAHVIVCPQLSTFLIHECKFNLVVEIGPLISLITTIASNSTCKQ